MGELDIDAIIQQDVVDEVAKKATASSDRSLMMMFESSSMRRWRSVWLLGIANLGRLLTPLVMMSLARAWLLTPMLPTRYSYGKGNNADVEEDDSSHLPSEKPPIPKPGSARARP
jgi:hypothetical protein